MNIYFRVNLDKCLTRLSTYTRCLAASYSVPALLLDKLH